MGSQLPVLCLPHSFMVERDFPFCPAPEQQTKVSGGCCCCCFGGEHISGPVGERELTAHVTEREIRVCSTSRVRGDHRIQRELSKDKPFPKKGGSSFLCGPVPSLTQEVGRKGEYVHHGSRHTASLSGWCSVQFGFVHMFAHPEQRSAQGFVCFGFMCPAHTSQLQN